MKFSEKEIIKLADLAKLELQASEVSLFSKQLTEIVNFVETLNRIDKKTIDKETKVYQNNVLREDEAIDSLKEEKELALKSANLNSNLVVAPKIN